MAAGARRPRSSWGPAPRAAACLLLWLALLPAWAQAAPPPPPTDPPAPSRTRFVGVCLDGTTACSPVVAVVATEQGWSLPAQVARELGLARFQFVPGSPDQALIPFDQAQWDDAQLTLTWQAPATDRIAQALTQATQAQWPDRLEQGFSAQLGYTVGLDTQGHASAGAALTAGRGNTWLSASGFAYGTRFQPGLAQLTHLRPEAAQRWTLGEQVAASADPLGGGVLLRGLSLRRDFSLQPGRFVRPLPAVSGVLEQPGVVEIYRNGVLIQTRAATPALADHAPAPRGRAAPAGVSSGSG